MTRRRLASLSVAGWFLACAATVLAAPAAQAQVLAVVYGEPITVLDVDQRAKLEQLGGQRPKSRKDVLDLIIDDKLKIREAARFGLTIDDREVDNAFASMASRMQLRPEQLVEVMRRQGTSDLALKSRIRADLAWQRLVRGRFSSSLTVGERDILAALELKNLEDKDATAYEYTLRPILFVVPPGAPSARFDARRREAEALRARFANCDEGTRVARALRDVAVREPMTRTSADLPPPMRTMLDNLEVGRLTTPEVTRHGIEMFALCNRVVSTTDTPARRQAREAVFNERFDRQARRYLQQIRRSAMIEYKSAP